MSRILVGVAGGIAAYKTCELVRRFRESGHEVTVVPTASALKFVGEATWAALSGQPVRTEVWQDVHEVPHVRLGHEVDLVVVAPATADLLSRAATGRADDLLTNVLLTTRAPILMVPAMHTEMWLHPAAQRNVAQLRADGVIVMDPAWGRLTGADTGPGRMPEPFDIAATAVALLAGDAVVAGCRARDLAGRRVVVSAGGTHEHLDPVRFLGNNSSGLMGVAIARAAALRGAAVTLVAANLSAPVPAGVDVVPVRSTADLAAVMQDHAARADIVIMAAAPADYTPAQVSDIKIKKANGAPLTLTLTETTDVLAALVRDRRPDQVIVGFAAETAASAEDLLALGRAKLIRKGCDLLVVNDVSGGAVFGSTDNTVTIVGRSGIVGQHAGDKNVVAHMILTAITEGRPTA